MKLEKNTIKTAEVSGSKTSADIKKIIAAAKKAGADTKGEIIDWGEGSVIKVFIDGNKIKFDGGESSGVDTFDNVKDAILSF